MQYIGQIMFNKELKERKKSGRLQRIFMDVVKEVVMWDRGGW